MQTKEPAILVVDDDEYIVELATIFLGKAGFTIIGTTDPEEAIRLVETNHSIKIVLSDICMPKLTGPEVIRRAFKVRDDVRVLFMSGGFTGVQFRQTDRFFRKPLLFDKVVEEIRAVLKEMPPPEAWEGPERRRNRGGALV
jgi:DNA-binding NtrC family response regulator